MKTALIWFELCNFALRFSVYNAWSSVLSFSNLKLYKTSAVKNICKAYDQPGADWQVNLAWACNPIENQYLVVNLKKTCDFDGL